MQRLFITAHMLVRLGGVLLLIMGLLIWTENATGVTPTHMLLGVLVVVALLVMAAVAVPLGASVGMAIAVAVMAAVTLVFGMYQMSVLPRPDPLHWIVQVAHLLIGMAAIGLAEALGGRLRRHRLARSAA
jgi:hypothetical protein